MPVNIEDRWKGIQKTRRLNPRTKEPIPGSLGLAYMVNRIKGGIERVAVLNRDEDKATVQRSVGGQILTVKIVDLRTEDELWFAIKELHPEVLPKSRGTPGTPSRWNPCNVKADVINRAVEVTA